jgi:hypothetical protein
VGAEGDESVTNRWWSMVGSGLLVAALAGQASAVPVDVVGEGEGTFSLGSNSGCFQGVNCRVEDTAQGADTRLEWGLGVQGTSSLTAVDTEIDTTTNDTGVAIATVSWTNTPIISLFGPSSFDAILTLNVNFTEPTASADPNATENINLHIVNTPNPASDQISGLTVSDLQGLSWNLNGVIVDNLQYKVTGGILTEAPNSTPENKAYVWTNAESNTSTLTITANFSSPSAVPEPTTLVLLGTGLVGVAAGAWRNRRRAR